MLFLPKLGTTIVFAGVNILDTDSVWQQPAGKKDKPLKLLKPDDPTLAAIMPKVAAPAVATSVVAEAAVAEAAPDAAVETPVAVETVEAATPAAEVPEEATPAAETTEKGTP
jgi:hypothetical protein